MTEKHTPGPWKAVPEGSVIWIEAPTQSEVAMVADARTDDAALIAAAPDLLRELQAAHQIIRNALNLMTTAQKMLWGEMNDSTHCAGEGITRANEREAVIQQATGRAL